MNRRMLATALAAALTLGAAQAAAQPPEPPPLFLFLYRQGPAWEAGKPINQQKLAPHAAYIRKLMAEGKVVAGGPWADGERGPADGGMAIVRAASREEAKALLAADPAITSGVFAADIRRWQPAIDSGKPLRP